jgi:methionyl-tRNA formyltransferase
MGDSLKKYVLLTGKSWHDRLFEELKRKVPGEWVRIRNKDSFTEKVLTEIKPEKIFIPHWSHIIPESIHEKYDCIVFHMTDLPFGRGGSPLQNLIIRGLKNTKITAIKVVKELDAGDIYLKRNLSLEGTAKDIFLRSVPIIEEMICKIIEENLQPAPQSGHPEFFKRRKPDESDIANLSTINEVYDYIRMLDCDGYPPAFIETIHFRIEFRDAEVINEKQIIAHVRIFQK